MVAPARLLAPASCSSVTIASLGPAPVGLTTAGSPSSGRHHSSLRASSWRRRTSLPRSTPLHVADGRAHLLQDLWCDLRKVVNALRVLGDLCPKLLPCVSADHAVAVEEANVSTTKFFCQPAPPLGVDMNAPGGSAPASSQRPRRDPYGMLCEALWSGLRQPGQCNGHHPLSNLAPSGQLHMPVSRPPGHPGGTRERLSCSLLYIAGPGTSIRAVDSMKATK